MAIQIHRSITMPMNKADFDQIILDIQANRTEEHLDLQRKLDDEQVTHLAKVLGANTSIKSFSLHSNQIGDRGAQALAEALKINTTLTTLGLLGNPIGGVGLKALDEALKINTTLQRLCLDYHQIEEAKKVNVALHISWDSRNRSQMFYQSLTSKAREERKQALDYGKKITKDILKNSTNDTILDDLLEIIKGYCGNGEFIPWGQASLASSNTSTNSFSSSSIPGAAVASTVTSLSHSSSSTSNSSTTTFSSSSNKSNGDSAVTVSNKRQKVEDFEKRTYDHPDMQNTTGSQSETMTERSRKRVRRVNNLSSITTTMTTTSTSCSNASSSTSGTMTPSSGSISSMPGINFERSIALTFSTAATTGPASAARHTSTSISSSNSSFSTSSTTTSSSSSNSSSSSTSSCSTTSTPMLD